MKKIYLLLSMFLTSCTTVTMFSDNENCISTRKFEVLQAVDGGALAYECTLMDGCSSFNQLVYLDWQPNVDYYDEMIVKVPSNKCAVRNGVYKYTTKQNIMKTVPVIKFEYKDNPKSEDEVIERIEDKYNRMYAACMYDAKANGQGETQEFCNCYAEQFIKYLVSLDTQENEEFSNDDFNNIAKKECGKFPDFIKDN